jgi:chromate transporter
MTKKLIEISWYFFRLGIIGFGGPLANVAYMQRDLVDEREWLSAEEFRHAFAMIKAMPGPVATQMALFLGRRRAGVLGGLLAGVMLILPCFIVMVLLAEWYSVYSSAPGFLPFFGGMQMGALALIFYSLRPLTHVYWHRGRFWFLLLAGYILTLLSVPEPILIFVLGCWAVILSNHKPSQSPLLSIATLPSTLVARHGFAVDALARHGFAIGQASLAPTLDPNLIAAAGQLGTSVLGDLFISCLQAGAFVFGTGLAIVPALQADFVTHHQWVTVEEFRDALAFGQLTPGPVVMTVTFIGQRLAGLVGATVATIGIFAPCFFHQLTWFPRAMSYMQKTKWIKAFLMGAISAVTAGIIYVLVEMLKDISAVQGAIFVGGLLLLLKYRIPPPILIVASGLVAFLPGYL